MQVPWATQPRGGDREGAIREGKAEKILPKLRVQGIHKQKRLLTLTLVLLSEQAAGIEIIEVGLVGCRAKMA